MSSITTLKGPFMTSAPPVSFLSLQELFAQHLPGYRRRPQQEQLAATAEEILTQNPGEHEPVPLLAEAGTGTGKSLAALGAAIVALHNSAEPKRIVVATATNALLGQYCVAPETRVLTADLRYIPAADVVEGMELVGFDEERVGTRRRYHKAVVENTEVIQRPCYRLTFDDGTVVIASSDHQWLVRRSQRVEWVTTENMSMTTGGRAGTKVIRLFDTWETDKSYEAGYLAAAFDGEGHLSQRKFNTGVSTTMGFAQRENEMHAQVEAYLSQLGFKASTYERPDIRYLGLNSRRKIARFLGQVRPVRLLAKFDVNLLGTLNTEDGTRLVKKEFVGVQDVVAMQTSTGTFVAEGLASHNCKKDLPWLEEVLAEAGISFTWAPLKGLSNFVCLSKMAATPAIARLKDLQDELSPNPDGSHDHTGDRDDIATPLDQRTEWPLVASTSDECPGRSKCAFGEHCFAMVHKDRAMEADIVATNTAVLLTDTKIGREAAGDDLDGDRVHPLLGPYTDLIVDEAHELEDHATSHLGFDIKQGGLLKWADQAASFLAVHEDVDEQRAGTSLDMNERVRNAADALTEPIARMFRHFENGSIDAEFVTEHADRFIELYEAVEALRARVSKRKITESSDQEREAAIKDRVLTTGRNFLSGIKAVLLADPGEMVRWAEMYGNERLNVGKRWQIRAAPISVGSYLREELWSRYPAVLMSATLTTGKGPDRFDYVARRLGLAETAAVLDVGSPFDYQKQALFFHPDSSAPAPAGKTRAEWETWLTAATLQLVRAAGGGAMLLYTSRRAMNAAHLALAPALRADGINAFVQGHLMSNKEIADRFRDDENSVLFGLRSFMTGFDAPGRTNRLVVIDKLPFPVPTDPIVSARSGAIEREGGNAFSDLVVPSMTLTLQQAFGRLIRSTDDWGTVAVMDSRLASKGYGRGIVRSMPPARVTTSLDEVAAFYQEREASGIKQLATLPKVG